MLAPKGAILVAWHLDCWRPSGLGSFCCWAFGPEKIWPVWLPCCSDYFPFRDIPRFWNTHGDPSVGSRQYWRERILVARDNQSSPNVLDVRLDPDMLRAQRVYCIISIAQYEVSNLMSNPITHNLIKTHYQTFFSLFYPSNDFPSRTWQCLSPTASNSLSA